MRTCRVPRPYNPYYGESDDEDFKVVNVPDSARSRDNNSDGNLDDQDDDLEELENLDYDAIHNDMGDLFDHGVKRYKSDKQGLRDFLNGCQLSLRLEGFHIKMAIPGYLEPNNGQFIENYRMQVDGHVMPSIEVIIDNFVVTARVK